MITMHVHRQCCHSRLHLQVYEEGECEGAKASREFKLNSSLVTPPETVTRILYVLKYKKMTWHLWKKNISSVNQNLFKSLSSSWLFTHLLTQPVQRHTIITALEACSADVNGQMRAGLLEPSSSPPCIKSMFRFNWWSSWAFSKQHWALQALRTGSQ